MTTDIKALTVAAMLATASFGAPAGDGHDHGGEKPVAAGAPAMPRFAASTGTFELVGVLDGRTLSLYLDRAADNSPVPDALLELEVGGAAVAVERTGEGMFEATLAAEPEPGEVPVTATVVAGDETDLLAGELDIHGAAHAGTEGGGTAWTAVAGWSAAAFAAAAFLYGLGRVRAARSGGAA
ncbi:hypothetical protein CCZ27_20780 [Thauera sinica]|nr:hypothetical protein CCZ27_20780 [Thauera sp. K11]